MFARPAEMEPGMWFRPYANGPALLWGGVVPVRSRFKGKHRVRVLVLRGGEDFVCDASVRFQVIEWEGRHAA